MKKQTWHNLKTFLLIAGSLLLVRMITGIPWWSFVIPVFALGVFVEIRRWIKSFFWIGFLAGFTVWAAAYCYYHFSFSGDVLTKGGFVPLPVVLLVTGLIGGLVTGTAFYAGSVMVHDRAEDLVL